MCTKHCYKVCDYLLICTSECRTVRCNHRDNISIANAFFYRNLVNVFIIISMKTIDTFRNLFVISILCRSIRNISFCIGFAVNSSHLLFYKRKMLNNNSTQYLCESMIGSSRQLRSNALLIAHKTCQPFKC